MARILFIVNEHPTEAFAIAVAKYTAEQLRAKGHEVIFKKIEPNDTMLGRVLKEKANVTFTTSELMKINANNDERIIKYIREYNPALSYTFHCTPAYSPYWQRYKNADFTIFDRDLTGAERLKSIEIKAHYKDLPERALRNIRSKIDYLGNFLYEQYLSQTTSQKLMENIGLTAKKFGKTIANKIITQWKYYSYLNFTKGRIERGLKKRQVMRRSPIRPKSRKI